MSYRFMRILVMFDLPVETLAQRRDYRQFRKSLLRAGFFMMQESIYCKLVLNAVAAGSVMKDVRANCPADGLVQMLLVTEKQYAGMELIVGDMQKEIIDTTERLVII